MGDFQGPLYLDPPKYTRNLPEEKRKAAAAFVLPGTTLPGDPKRATITARNPNPEKLDEDAGKGKPVSMSRVAKKMIRTKSESMGEGSDDEIDMDDFRDDLVKALGRGAVAARVVSNTLHYNGVRLFLGVNFATGAIGVWDHRKKGREGLIGQFTDAKAAAKAIKKANLTEDALTERQKTTPTLAFSGEEKSTRTGAFKVSSKVLKMWKDKEGQSGPDKMLFNRVRDVIAAIPREDLPKIWKKKNMADAQDLVSGQPKKAFQMWLRNIKTVSPKLAKYVAGIAENTPLVYYAFMGRVVGNDMADIIFKRYFATESGHWGELKRGRKNEDDGLDGILDRLEEKRTRKAGKLDTYQGQKGRWATLKNGHKVFFTTDGERLADGPQEKAAGKKSTKGAPSGDAEWVDDGVTDMRFKARTKAKAKGLIAKVKSKLKSVGDKAKGGLKSAGKKVKGELKSAGKKAKSTFTSSDKKWRNKAKEMGLKVEELELALKMLAEDDDSAILAIVASLTGELGAMVAEADGEDALDNLLDRLEEATQVDYSDVLP